MKRLNFNDKTFEAEKIVKTDTDIIGQDSNGNEIFRFKGITNFIEFSLEAGQEFDVEESLIDKLLLDNLNMQTQIDSIITNSLGGN